jgi:hypothetical protein
MASPIATTVSTLRSAGPAGSSIPFIVSSAAHSSQSAIGQTGVPPWGAYTSLDVQKGIQFHFTLHLATALPKQPDRFGNALEEWTIALDTNRATAATGWPTANHSAGGPNPAEYLVQLWWDGHHFGAAVANRTPLLHHQSAVLTNIPFAISDRTISFTVPAGLVGNPSHFGFLAYYAVDHDPVVAISAHGQVTIRPGSDRVFVGNENAPWDPPACAYNDTLLLPTQNSRGGNCWAVWSWAHDAHRPVIAPGGPAWGAVLHNYVSEAKMVNVEWRMSGDVPANPQVVGARSIIWGEFLYSSNPAANVTGWPFPPGFGVWNYTYSIIVAWDGANYGAALVDNTPTLHGGNPVATPIAFTIDDESVSVSFPSSLVGHTSLAGSSWLVVADTAKVLKVNAAGHIVLLNGSLMYEILDEAICAPIAFDTCP